MRSDPDSIPARKKRMFVLNPVDTGCSQRGVHPDFLVCFASDRADVPPERRPGADKQKGNYRSTMEGYLSAIAENGDKQAFAKIFEHFAPRIKAFAMRGGVGPEMADEIVQETLVKVWNKSGQFDPDKASAGTWIFTIARNQRIDLLRKANRPEPDFDDPAFVPQPEPQPLDILERNHEAELLRSIVRNLAPEQQEVLQLAFMEDLPHGEVAKKLGIPLGTVKSRIRLAMKHIRSEIGDIR